MPAADTELLQEYVRNNSEDAFASIVSRHLNLVYSAALRQTGDPHLSEDVTQAVFVILARKAGTLSPTTPLSGWLCRTARYASADAVKSERRRRRREQEALMNPAPDEPTHSAWTQLAPLLDDALQHLSEKDHNALVLRFFEGKSMAEVGAVLGATEASVKMRVHRALEKLRRYFARRNVRLSTALIASALPIAPTQAAPAALAATITAAAANHSTLGNATLAIIDGTMKSMFPAHATSLAFATVCGILALGVVAVALTGAGPAGAREPPATAPPAAIPQTDPPRASAAANAAALLAETGEDDPPIFLPPARAVTRPLQIVGNHLFIAAWGHGVQVLDISNPAQPRWVGAWNPRRSPMGIHVSGTRAYVAERLAGLSILDVSDPANPVLTASIKTRRQAFAAEIAGDYAYIPDGMWDQHAVETREVVDIRNPAGPRLLGDFPVPQPASRLPFLENRGPVHQIQILGDRAYVASAQAGLLIFDITDPSHPQLLDGLESETNNLPILVDNRVVGHTDMLALPAFREHLEQTYPTDLPRNRSEVVARLRASPIYYSQYTRRGGNLPRALKGLHASSSHLLAWTYQGMIVIDAADAKRPRQIGEFQSAEITWDVAGAGDFACLMTTGAGIRVIDLRDPGKPVEAGRFDARYYSSAVLAADPAERAEAERLARELAAGAPPGITPITDAPELINPEALPEGAFAFTLSGIGESTYRIQASADLVSWRDLHIVTLPEDGQLRVVDHDAAARAHRFYRAVQIARPGVSLE